MKIRQLSKHDPGVTDIVQGRMDIPGTYRLAGEKKSEIGFVISN
jgi:hypothetical protein